jgi:membrane-bound metal-dependent hydrolase YbcI (DUF457 family)
MFIGHFAVGFASKRVAPRASLGPLMAAPLLLDLLWPIFLLLGWERVRIQPGYTAFNPLVLEHYPWSHSLVMSLVWGALFGALYWSRTRYRAGAVVIGLGVVSHWVLDWVTHTPDMPLWPGASPMLGLGLWNSVAGTVIVESLMFVAAVWIYVRATTARDAVGRYAFWALVTLLAILYAESVVARNAVPQDLRVLAYAALLTWLFPVWAWWFDSHRDVVT